MVIYKAWFIWKNRDAVRTDKCNFCFKMKSFYLMNGKRLILLVFQRLLNSFFYQRLHYSITFKCRMDTIF